MPTGRTEHAVKFERVGSFALMKLTKKRNLTAVLGLAGVSDSPAIQRAILAKL
ncbi:hypothetical protein PSE_0160 [Pseudovibrio sp. FO-BEG1]|nr:hypothetical protein PSE_0160 [Pseudovibrio sp. FO-BEG1]